MKTTTRHLSLAVAGLLAVLVLPMPSDGSQATCCNVSTSLASSVNQPVAGDEDFFTLRTGPAAVMILMDNSGSMMEIPQCTESNPFSSGGDCPFPISTSSVATPSTNPTYGGTCTVAGTALSWMTSIPLDQDNADPGFTGGVVDSPPWSTPSCSGNSCLFRKDGYYEYGTWTETSAPQLSLTDPCTLVDSSGNPVQDYYGQTVTFPGCKTCLDGSGFFFGVVKYKTSSTNVRTVSKTFMKGAWLNGNPPKFISARRAVKKIVQIADAGNLQARDLIRYGLSTFANTDSSNNTVGNSNSASTSMRSTDGAKLVVPLGPNCTQGDPTNPNATAIVAARTAIVNAVNSTSRPIRFANYTPLAEALFNIGQYFSDVGTGSAYQSRFGTSWLKTGFSTYYAAQDFRESSAGDVNASWVQASAGRQASVCWACQQSAVIIVTDGMPNNENNLPLSTTSSNHASQPAWDFRYWQPADYRTACGGNRAASGDGCSSYLPLVASYLHNQDQRLNDLTGVQSVATHTVSFGITDTQALKVMEATATTGGGTFTNTTDYTTLLAGLNRAVNAVIQRTTSFSATAASSLQTSQTSATETFLARFRPTNSRQFEGHLYQAILFDEFANGCDPNVGPTAQARVACGNTTVYPNFPVNADGTGNVDEFGHNICTDAYLVDLDCDEVGEDSLGNFIKKRTAGNPTPTPANLVWDAGRVLSTPGATGYRSAAESDVGAVKARNIFTWINGARVAFTTANLATLQPYLGLDDTACTNLLGSIPGFTSSYITGLTASARLTACAQQIVHYVRGYDVFDENANLCSAPGNPQNSASTCPNGEERNYSASDPEGKRMWKLGDIFHSSPAVVKPPIDEVRCDLGFEGQCLPVIHSPAAFSTSTPIDSYSVSGRSVDAYEAWRLASNGSLTNRTRKRLVLAGANDGMLHAFDAGDALAASSDPTNRNPDLFGAYAYSAGTGEEVWAFIPPDLLPRLRNLLTLNYHQYMVDGPTMVRDVWVDANNDGRKQSTEFHTVAVMSERSGGSQFTALNLDDPLVPTVLWSFPLPCSEDARYMGESWTDFAPRPPPIGPVRLRKVSDPRGFEERWVVALNGGYDPLMIKGRAVFLVDIWSGARLWRFTDDDFKASIASPANNHAVSMWPVPAGIALLDVGDPRTASRDVDGFFDTATWGDLGGQLWVARFHTIGELSGGVVTNWTAARTFEEQRRTDGIQWVTSNGSSSPPNEVRSPFFFMTSNVFEPTTRTVRTYAGGGNREAMLVQDVSCSPSNVLGCCQAGCSSVETTTVDGFGACQSTQRFRCTDSGRFERDTFSPSATCGSALTCSATSATAVTSQTTFRATCGAYTASYTATMTCNQDGTCTTYAPMGPGRAVDPSYLRAPQSHGRFYGVWSFGKDAAKMFDIPGQTTATALQAARAFDANRFTDVTIGRTCSGPDLGTCTLVDVTQAVGQYSVGDPTGIVTTGCLDGSAKCWANPTDAGWYYEYGQVCPTDSCSTAPPWNDEKTSSGGTVVYGCSIWTGFRPVGAAGGADACGSTIGTPSFFQYGAAAISGVPTRACGYNAGEGVIYRAGAVTHSYAPPNEPKIRVVMNPKGEVAYSALDIGNPGAPTQNRQVATRKETVEPVYWLEVPGDLHQCRHVSDASCR